MNEQQQLLARVLDLFAQRFAQHAVLRGGMVLRILGCERLTNDLDYVFVPYRSKNDIVASIVTTLKSIPDAEVRHSVNSKCLRAIVSLNGVSIQIEAKVALTVPTETLSTRNLARLHDLPPRLIPVLDYRVALADKMAAWNERRLARDLYDIWFWLRMGVRPDEQALLARLRHPSYSKRIPHQEHFRGGHAGEFYDFLRSEAGKLTDAQIVSELADYLAPTELAGLSMMIRAELAKLGRPAQP